MKMEGSPTKVDTDAPAAADGAKGAADNLPAQANGTAGIMDEHPDAPAIRKQVEFYFSDENLRSDLFLLQCCSGRDNVPVSMSRICGFRKMRKYKRKVAIAALRSSDFLDIVDVIEDGKKKEKIKRKVPLQGKCLLDENFLLETDPIDIKIDAKIPQMRCGEDTTGDALGDAKNDGIAYDPRTKRAIAYPVAPLPQSKKPLPPGMTKNMLKPTGFEPTYAEAPLTPAEAEEELAMYDPKKPISERLEIAIQRFKSKRRMHEMYARIFNKWMKYGGVEVQQRMFRGMDQASLREMDAEEIAKALATHYVPFDREDPKKWEVDFLGVGEGFLSSFYPVHYGHNPKDVATACQVLRSFYNYLLFHRVCSEHTSQLLAARSLCDKAERELPQVFRAGCALPGAFNVAASVIYEGHHAGQHISTAQGTWGADFTEEEAAFYSSVGMAGDDARVVCATGIAVCGSEEQNSLLLNSEFGKLSKEVTKPVFKDVNLEVVGIEPPTEEVKAAYAAQIKKWAHNPDSSLQRHLKPLGKLICKSVQLSEFDFRTYDLPHGATHPSQLSPESASKKDSYMLWVEQEVLTECFVGLKMEARVMMLDGGIEVLDAVKDCFCSFYRFLPNEYYEARRAPEFRLRNKGLEDVLDVEEGKDNENGGELEGGGKDEEDEDVEI